MKEITRRLSEDMRWRLTSAAKSFAPTQKERQNWGAARISGATSCLSWLALCTFNYALINGLLLSGLNAGGGGVAAGLLSLPLTLGMTFILNLLLLPAVYMFSARLQCRRDLAAYRRLTESNERFMLVEYVKYLERQAQRIRTEPPRGSTAEAESLLASANQIRAILAAQAATARAKQAAGSGPDSTLAESVVEAYASVVEDPIQSLDQRLTEDQRLKVADLERSLALQETDLRVSDRS